MNVQRPPFRGFANPVDPTPAEMRAWAYHPDSVDLQTLPHDWDLLVVNEQLIPTLFDLGMDTTCPARRFALHCLYIYAANEIRSQSNPKRRLRKMLEHAEQDGDALLAIWAHNVRALMGRPQLFEYHDWCEGGLVREPRRIA